MYKAKVKESYCSGAEIRGRKISGCTWSHRTPTDSTLPPLEVFGIISNITVRFGRMSTVPNDIQEMMIC